MIARVSCLAQETGDLKNAAEKQSGRRMAKKGMDNGALYDTKVEGIDGLAVLSLYALFLGSLE